jgi:hypothetical protein
MSVEVKSSSWHSYPKVYALGHREVLDVLKGDVIVQEKVDGSQFSFALIDGELHLKSRGADIYVADTPKMFNHAVLTVQRLQEANLLHPGWTYRAEYLSRPKHNALAYDRTPKDHLILFDVSVGNEQYLPYDEVVAEGQRLGLEVVPLLYAGHIDSYDMFAKLLETTSLLGGQKIEGVVIKNYALTGRDGHTMMAKFVSETFKEIHRHDWKKDNPMQRGILEKLIMDYKTEARWHKGVQHMNEAGALLGEPKDIGPLMRAIGDDLWTECEGEIRDALWDWAWPHIRRGVTAGVAEWYKERLAKSAFEDQTV